MPAVPFPPRSGRYEVRAGLTPLARGLPADGGAARFILDHRASEYLALKLGLLRRHAAHVRCLAEPHDAAALTTLLLATFAALAAEHPEVAIVHGETVVLPAFGIVLDGPELHAIGDPALGPLGVHAAEWIASQQGVARLADALALSIQDDFAVVHAPGAGRDAPIVAATDDPPSIVPADRLELLHVAFPSHWDPAAKVGRDFSTVHAPVASGEGVRAAHAGLVRGMVTKGPFVRFAWGIATDGLLPHNPVLHTEAPLPPEAATDPATAAAHAWYRVERQVMVPFPDLERALFQIRSYVMPVAEIAAEPEAAGQLAAALRSMSVEELRYKGLVVLRDPLVAWLEAAAG